MSPRLHTSYAGCYGYTSGMVGHLSLVCGSWRTQVQEHFGPGHQLPGFYTTAEHQLPGNLRTTSSLVEHSHWLLWLALVTPTPVHQFGWHGMFMSTTFHSSGKWLEDMRVVGIAKPVAPSGVSVRAPCSMALFPTELCILYHQTLQSEYTPKVMWGN